VAKRRFGVSLPEPLASRLDELAHALGVERSRLVEDAVRQYLEDHGVLAGGGGCRGVIVVACPGPATGVELAEDYKDVVNAVVHAHAEGVCIEVILVKGARERIAGLYKRLRERGCRTRFIPAPE